jgi:curved DNA-binding protein CbpA
MKQSLNLFRKNRLYDTRFNRLFRTKAFSFAEKMKIRKDYYEILCIPKNATEEQIKQAYRSLAKKYHPDVNIGGEQKYEPSTQKFREIAEAYAVLSNKTMKIDYDTRLRNFPDSDLSLDK